MTDRPADFCDLFASSTLSHGFVFKIHNSLEKMTTETVVHRVTVQLHTETLVKQNYPPYAADRSTSNS